VTFSYVTVVISSVFHAGFIQPLVHRGNSVKEPLPLGSISVWNLHKHVREQNCHLISLNLQSACGEITFVIYSCWLCYWNLEFTVYWIFTV